MTNMDQLESLMRAAAVERDVPSSALLARIVQDADRVQARPALQIPRKGLFATLSDWFGGGFSLAGMSIAALTGLYLGVVQPTPVLALADLVSGQAAIENLDVLPATDMLWAQE